MSEVDQSGYRQVPKPYDVERWQRRLFAELRKAPGYCRLLDQTREAWRADGEPGKAPLAACEFGRSLKGHEAYNAARSHVVTTWGLTRKGRPASWAKALLHEDVLGVFEDVVRMSPVTIPHRRAVGIEISPSGYEVSTYPDMDEPNDEIWSPRQIRHALGRSERFGMVGKAEWAELEELAVDAARHAVADLRAEYGDNATQVYDTVQIALAREKSKQLQIERLALRIIGRPGGRNDRRTDERWCAYLGIDKPRHP